MGRHHALRERLRDERSEHHPDLVDHLVRTTHLPAGVARRVVDDVVAYFSEPVEAFVRRRHRELQAAGLANAAIFDRIAAELAVRPVAAPTLSPGSYAGSSTARGVARCAGSSGTSAAGTPCRC